MRIISLLLSLSLFLPYKSSAVASIAINPKFNSCTKPVHGRSNTDFKSLKSAQKNFDLIIEHHNKHISNSLSMQLWSEGFKEFVSQNGQARVISQITSILSQAKEFGSFQTCGQDQKRFAGYLKNNPSVWCFCLKDLIDRDLLGFAFVDAHSKIEELRVF